MTTRSFKNAQDAKAFCDEGYADGSDVSVNLACDRCGVRAPFVYTRSGDDYEQVLRELHLLAKMVGFEGDVCAECSGKALPEGCTLVIIGEEKMIGLNDSLLEEYKEGLLRRRNAS